VHSRTSDPRRRGGFTLVEIVVALVIAAGLAGAVFTLLNGQSRMVSVQGSRQEAQQNVRGALEVLSSELRGAVPGAITVAGSQTLTFMQPRAWGVVCAAAGGVVTAVFPAVNALDAFTVSETNGVVVQRNPFTANPVLVPDPQVAAPARITAVATLASPTAGACATSGASAGARAVQITTNGAFVGAVAGDLAVTYTLTRYDIAQVDGKWWLRRSNGVSNGVYNQQPLAGPLDQSLFRFTYFAGTPPAEVPAPTTAAERRALRMVRVQVVANSTQSLEGRTQRDSGAVTILLRN
jgi:prepilin-type N-terminal cleavage/methylation domain-containing protein